MGVNIALTGFLLIFLVPMAMFFDGVRSDEDFWQWMLSKPLPFIVGARICIIFGLSLMLLGSMLHLTGWK